MSSDMEELAREGMRQVTATLHAPPDLAARAYEQHKRRRRAGFAGLGVAGAAAGTALALGLTSVLAPAPARSTGTIRTLSFTLVSNANGTATLTINPKELLDPAALQNDLQHDGIPAIVNSGSFCTSDPAPAGFSQAVTSNPSGEGTGTPGPGPEPTITIDPSAIPSGTELSVGYFQLTSDQYAGSQQADMVLIDTSSYTCTSTPPDPPVGPPAGYGESDSMSLLYGSPGPGGS